MPKIRDLAPDDPEVTSYDRLMAPSTFAYWTQSASAGIGGRSPRSYSEFSPSLSLSAPDGPTTVMSLERAG